MICKVIAAVLTLILSVRGQSTCKNPIVEERRMADDVRYASPFYVIALPRTPKTDQIDNVCYTYYEAENNTFFHIMSIVYQNGSNSYYKLSKSDIFDRNGLAEAKAEAASTCIYHDYTLKPICNFSVFILYRCFIQGTCNDADAGAIPGVDVRLALAASTTISDECRQETEATLRDTSSLEGGDYIILPQRQKPQCITSFGDRQSLNPLKALGSIAIKEENNFLNRLGDDDPEDSFTSNTAGEISPSVATGSATLQFLTQHTPQTSAPKRTYADVVKSSPKLSAERGMNVIHYNQNHLHSDSCSCA